MKKSLLLFVQFCLATLLFCEDYNFYERNLETGEIDYSNLDYSTGFRYELLDEGNHLEMVGYYYDCPNIKFVDTIAKSRIQKIEYFDKNGNSILTCAYQYDGKNVSSITTVITAPSKMFYSINFDKKTRRFNMISSVENKNGNMLYKVSEGIVDKNNNPVSAKLKAFSFDGSGTKFSCVDEKWKTGKKSSTYQVIHNNKQIYLYEENANSIKTSSFQDADTELTITETFDDKREIKIVNYNGRETLNGDYSVRYKYKSFKHLLDNAEQSRTHERYSVQDELVFLLDGQLTVHQLFLPFDFFGDNDFHQGFIKVKVVE